MILAREVREFERMPRGYGLAWWKSSAMIAVCLPIPFNVIARNFRTFWLRLQLPQGSDLFESCWKDGYAAGRNVGYQQGQSFASDMLMDVRREILSLREDIRKS